MSAALAGAVAETSNRRVLRWHHLIGLSPRSERAGLLAIIAHARNGASSSRKLYEALARLKLSSVAAVNIKSHKIS